MTDTDIIEACVDELQEAQDHADAEGMDVEAATDAVVDEITAVYGIEVAAEVLKRSMQRTDEMIARCKAILGVSEH